jgi:hypothetical protein
VKPLARISSAHSRRTQQYSFTITLDFRGLDWGCEWQAPSRFRAHPIEFNAIRKSKMELALLVADAMSATHA